MAKPKRHKGGEDMRPSRAFWEGLVTGWRQSADRRGIGLLLAVTALNWTFLAVQDGKWWSALPAALSACIGISEILAKPRTEKQ